MVLLEELGLRVEVLVNDVAAEELSAPAQPDVADEDLEFYPFIRERYIESEAGVEIAVSFAVLDTHGLLKAWVMAEKNNAVGLRVWIDGHSVHKGFVGLQSDNRNVRGVINRTNNTMKKFQFVAISQIEDAPKELETLPKEQTKDLGTIQVHIHRLAPTKPANPTPAVCGLPQGDEIVLAEKALAGRALVHGVSLAPPGLLQPVRAARRAVPKKAKWMDPLDEPIAIFRFMYRSKEALKRGLIIPRTPRPEPSPSPELQSVDDLSPEEIRRLAQERLSELQDRKQAERFKKEEDEAAQPNRPLKYARTSGGRQAIDLTEDD